MPMLCCQKGSDHDFFNNDVDYENDDDGDGDDGDVNQDRRCMRKRRNAFNLRWSFSLLLRTVNPATGKLYFKV